MGLFVADSAIGVVFGDRAFHVTVDWHVFAEHVGDHSALSGPPRANLGKYVG